MESKPATKLQLRLSSRRASGPIEKILDFTSKLAKNHQSNSKSGLRQDNKQLLISNKSPHNHSKVNSKISLRQKSGRRSVAEIKKEQIKKLRETPEPSKLVDSSKGKPPSKAVKSIINI